MYSSFATQFHTRFLESILLQVGKEFVDEDEENGEGKLYFTGTGYTINLIPQAIILGVLAFRKSYTNIQLCPLLVVLSSFPPSPPPPPSS
jgi:hypothetical protein